MSLGPLLGAELLNNKLKKKKEDHKNVHINDVCVICGLFLNTPNRGGKAEGWKGINLPQRIPNNLCRFNPFKR